MKSNADRDHWGSGSCASRQGDARLSPEWRVLFLSTGEVSLGTKLAEAGLKTMAGQETRFVELEADAEAGFGTFENLHGFDSGASFSKALKTACKIHYGHAARAFLAALTADSEGLRDELVRAIANFAARHCPPGADGQVYRAAERFGLVAAAGSQATKLGVLPWEEDEAAKAAGRLFAEWVDNQPDFQRMAPTPLSTVCFCATPTGFVSTESLNLLNRKLMDAVNRSGEAYITHTMLGERLVLRFVVSHLRTTEAHVRSGWEIIQAKLREVRGG